MRGKADAAELKQAFHAELAAVNLQRLFWLLIVGLVTRVASLALNHLSAASSDVMAAM